jgi:hypothetical protein
MTDHSVLPARERGGKIRRPTTGCVPARLSPAIRTSWLLRAKLALRMCFLRNPVPRAAADSFCFGYCFLFRRISEGKDLRTGPKRTYPPWAGSANVPMIGEATSGQHIEVGVSNRPRAITPVTGTFFDEHNSYLGMQLGAVRTATFCGPKNVLSRLGKANRNPWVQGASNYALRGRRPIQEGTYKAWLP